MENRDKQHKIGVITGAAGFIGRHLTNRLMQEGWTVHVIVLPHEADFWRGDKKPNVHVYDGHIESLFSALDGLKEATVFHLATWLLSEHKPQDVRPLIESNVLFGTELVEAMVANEIYRLINTGSYAQHYENKDYSPATLYAATKEAFEAILVYYYESTPLRVITLKPFNVYGPGDPKERLFPLLRRASVEGKPLAMSPGEQIVDLVYIDDVVDAYLLAAERFETSEVAPHEEYMLSGTRMKLREIADLYSRLTGRRVPIQWGGRPYRIREIMVPWDRGTPLPGWAPKVTVEEGIRRLEEAYELASRQEVNKK